MSGGVWYEHEQWSTSVIQWLVIRPEMTSGLGVAYQELTSQALCLLLDNSELCTAWIVPFPLVPTHNSSVHFIGAPFYCARNVNFLHGKIGSHSPILGKPAGVALRILPINFINTTLRLGYYFILRASQVRNWNHGEIKSSIHNCS